MPFQPGQSGNPGGQKYRVGVTYHLKQLIDKRDDDFHELSTYLANREQAKGLGKVTMGRRVACRLLERADEGDMNAIKEVMDRVDGKVKDESNMTALPSINIQTNVLVQAVDTSTPAVNASTNVLELTDNKRLKD